jgi:hypothetical protein
MKQVFDAITWFHFISFCIIIYREGREDMRNALRMNNEESDAFRKGMLGLSLIPKHRDLVVISSDKRLADSFRKVGVSFRKTGIQMEKAAKI